MKLPGSLGELSYCTNIHRGETLREVVAGLDQVTTLVKAEVSPNQPFGVGLRLSAEAAEELRERQAIEAFSAFLGERGLYVFTLNGFPYGRFHGEPIKARVYEPDWSSALRLHYTNALADVLTELLPSGGFGSISTLPGCFRPKAQSSAILDVIAQRLLQHAAHLHALREQTGKTIALGLEPEPHCLLETTSEALRFIEENLLAKAALQTFAGLTGLTPEQSEAFLRETLGLCLDTCHAAVEFETPAESVAAARQAGIVVAKVQLSAGLVLAPVTEAALLRLRQFDEPVYLHQVVVQQGGALTRYLDVPDALEQGGALTRYLDVPDALEQHGRGRDKNVSDEQWRVHFHVPLYRDSFGVLGSTRRYVEGLLALHASEPITRHLEVETYTWDVLPQTERQGSVHAAIAAELRWVRGEFRS